MSDLINLLKRDYKIAPVGSNTVSESYKGIEPQIHRYADRNERLRLNDMFMEALLRHVEDRIVTHLLDKAEPVKILCEAMLESQLTKFLLIEHPTFRPFVIITPPFYDWIRLNNQYVIFDMIRDTHMHIHKSGERFLYLNWQNYVALNIWHRNPMLYILQIRHDGYKFIL